MPVTMVAAVARNGVIGARGGLPWHLPDDLRHFKQVTLGHAMVMGRKTFESIGRALPGRTTVVITRDPTWSAPGTLVARDLDAALRAAEGAVPGRTVMVVGGGDVFRQVLPLADRLELTEIDAEADGDTHFPTLDPADWVEVARDGRDGFAFVSLRRRPR